MPVIVREPDSKDYERAEDGQYLGVIVDVVDLGEVQTGFGVKPKVQIVWLLNADDSEGNPFRVSAFYTASLHEKANLRKALKSILGADVSGEFDLENLLGVNNQLVVQTIQNGEKVYTNIVAILKAPKGERMEIPADFVRSADKKKNQPKAGVKKPAPALKKPATAPLVEQEYVQEAPASAPTPVAMVPVTTARTATIRPARATVAAPTPSTNPSANPSANPTVAELRKMLAAAEAATPLSQPIDDQDIPF
jgi:hypothetical protein